MKPLATFDAVRQVQQASELVQPANDQGVRRKELDQLVADQIDDGLEIQLLGHPVLDAVDHRQLGIACLGLLQQPLRLVEEAGVLQRHAHAGGERFQEANVGLAVRVLAPHVHELQDAARLTSRYQRHHQLRLGGRGMLGILDVLG